METNKVSQYTQQEVALAKEIITALGGSAENYKRRALLYEIASPTMLFMSCYFLWENKRDSIYDLFEKVAAINSFNLSLVKESLWNVNLFYATEKRKTKLRIEYRFDLFKLIESITT